jgi:alkylation response protein AidB-like acyl-CoA dehydrogenase
MNFGLSEEQELLQQTVRQYVENEAPVTRVRELFDGDAPYDPAAWKGLCELGIAGLMIPEEYGGAELGMVDLALVAEVLGHAAFAGPFFGHALTVVALLECGSDAQKAKWLPPLAAGDALGAVALGEGEGHWGLDEWNASVSGDTVSGVKDWVPGGAGADLLVVGVSGGELVLVEAAASGVSMEAVDSMDRTRRCDRIALDNAPCETLGGGRAAAERVRDAALVLLAADAFGGASRCTEMSVEYAKTREQFGVTIGHFQALKHQLANMALAIEPSRGLYWYAAHAIDHAPDEAERISAVAKAHITDNFMQIARDSVEAHGGIGFTWECDVQIWFKRAMFDRAFFGNPACHRERSSQLAGW